MINTSDDLRVFNYQGYEPEKEGVREVLCTLGNSCLATSAEFPGKFDDRWIEKESLVNLPNCRWMQLAINNIHRLDHIFERHSLVLKITTFGEMPIPFSV